MRTRRIADREVVDRRVRLRRELRHVRHERGREPRDHRRALALRRPALELHRSAQQQALSRSCHRDVQDPVLLLGLRPAALLRELLVVQRRDRLRAVEPAQHQADAPAVDEQLRLASVGHAPEVRHANHGELQALGRVDAHEAHRVGLDAFDGRVGLTGRRSILQALGVVEEQAQVASLGRFEAAREPQQLVHVGKAPLAPLEPEHVLAVAARCDHALDQLRQGALSPLGALALDERVQLQRPMAVLRSERFHSLGARKRRPHATCARARGARQQREPVAREPGQRRGQHAEQRLLVERVREHPQIREQVADLLVHPEAAGSGERAQPAQLQRALIHLEVATGAQQHRDLARSRGSVLNQLGDALREQARLGLTPQRRRRQPGGDLLREPDILLPAALGAQQQLDAR